VVIEKAHAVHIEMEGSASGNKADFPLGGILLRRAEFFFVFSN
jgi:hypothetical protein